MEMSEKRLLLIDYLYYQLTDSCEGDLFHLLRLWTKIAAQDDQTLQFQSVNDK